MMGEEIPTGHVIPEKAGIIPRFTQRLFNIITGSEKYSETKVEISYFEIYNEKIHDLLGPSMSGRSAPLRVREHPEMGPYVVDLTVHNVQSFETLQDWLRVGNTHKATAATEMNMNSSRSHAIFTVTLTQSQQGERLSFCSKINLIDLAGSERLTHTCASGDRLKEGVSINRSLLTLGKVISSLAERKKRVFIPYRESVLTWLLRESLGGNSRTAMLATISPSCQFVDETLSTLRYACQARNIVNTVRINDSPQKRIRDLLEEIQRLRDGSDILDHTECVRKIRSLEDQLEQTTEELHRANLICSESEKEIEKITNELTRRDLHDDCEDKLYDLQKRLSESNNWNHKYEREISELKQSLSSTQGKHLHYEEQINELARQMEELTRDNHGYKEEIFKLENQVEEFRQLTKQLKSEINKLDRELRECKTQNSDYLRDLEEMKASMEEIKANSDHEPCENQIHLLQTALSETEKIGLHYKEKISNLEQRLAETRNISNHDGCEKEISALKENIAELKKMADHEKCSKVIGKLKSALSEVETFSAEIESEANTLKQENSKLKTIKDLNENEIISLKNSLLEAEKKNNHEECESRINTLKKALNVAKSMNSHVQCENRIADLEIELRNMQSVTLSDHTHCEEKINNLFYSIEKYAEENSRLVDSHREEVLKYQETIKDLESQLENLTDNEKENRRTLKESSQDLTYLEKQMRILKEENARIKRKKVDDEKKISSLEQQVISLTKELLDVKSQLRVSQREKESSDSLCAQLKEQLLQQDLKLARPQSSRQLFNDEDKENWETPSKVIRRSIAKYSNWANKENERCSLVMKAEEIHEALKDAEDICSRLKIPWVFQLEPEVTTHSWFDVNVRVWDQRTMSSVRWPREVFLGWLREMKEEIMSRSRGQKLFHCSPWLKRSTDPDESEDTKKLLNFREDVDKLRKEVGALEAICKSKRDVEISSAVTAFAKSLSQLSSKLGNVSPLRPVNTNT